MSKAKDSWSGGETPQERQACQGFPEAQPKIIQTITKDRLKNCRLLTPQRLWCHNQKEHQEEHKHLFINCQEALS